MRCPWAESSKLMIDYHDLEWGRPLHDDQKLFELLTLEGFQAGLSWSIILNKREEFRKAFDYFNPIILLKYKQDKIRILTENKNIIRNRKKIEATINNAERFMEIKKEFGSFDLFIWKFVNGKQIDHELENMHQIPVKTKESEAMSKLLKARGFKFVGPTICYSFMQAAGLVNDHLISCFCYDQIKDIKS